jgi:gamma-tubulin complex component 3
MDRLGPGTAATSEEQAVPPKFQSSSLSLEKAGDSTAPSEKALLRDLPFTLQGLSSVNLSFVSKNTLIIPPTLPLPIVSLLYTLAEPSLLYSSLSAFVESREEGLIGQSLRAAIGIELRSYLGLIATLEGEIRRSIAIANEDDPRAGVSKVGVTLKRCVAWTRDATMGLRLMSLMAEESKSMFCSRISNICIRADEAQARRVASSYR